MLYCIDRHPTSSYVSKVLTPLCAWRRVLRFSASSQDHTQHNCHGNGHTYEICRGDLLAVAYRLCHLPRRRVQRERVTLELWLQYAECKANIV